MPLDPALLAETSAWVRKAEADLRAAELLLHADTPLTSQVCFHAQQAAEKSLKALLVWNHRPLSKTHDLAKLGKLCVDIDQKLGPAARRVAPLTEFAIESRYPGDWEDPSLSEAREALVLAREMYDAILAPLPAEAAP